MYEFNTKYDVIIDNLVRAGIRYVEKNPAVKTMVLGMSGGVDSMVTAALARKVADATGIKLYGFVLPIEGNKQDEVFRGMFGAAHICHEHELRQLDEAYNLLAAQLDPEAYGTIPRKRTIWQKIRLGNIKARIRMIFLYGMAAKLNGMVLSTDNLTELLLGFWTLHGDVGDFGFLQNVWKTEVFGMAKQLGDDCLEAAEAKPTDGLGVSNSDLDQLLPGWEGDDFQAGYKLVDEILMDVIAGKNIFAEDHPVVQRYRKTRFKRENPFNVCREIATSGTGTKPDYAVIL